MLSLQNPANLVPLSEQAWGVVLGVTVVLALAWVVFVVVFTRYREQHRPRTTGEARTRGVETRVARRGTVVVVAVVSAALVVALLAFVLGRAGDLFA